MRLLIVEDDVELANELRRAFARRHIRCDLVHDAGDADILIGTTSYALIILDLGLPDEDGLGLLRRIKAVRPGELILVLTARHSAESRIDGFSAGADDYLLKPFHFDELHARVRAILRRGAGYKDRLLVCGPVELDPDTRECWIDGKLVEISVRESKLLEIMMRRLDRLVPKKLIEDHLFGGGSTLGSNAVEVYIHRIRRHLETANVPVNIQTIRGVGYILLSR
jgi:two-component system response regulator TctD